MPEIDIKLSPGFIAGAWRWEGNEQKVLSSISSYFDGSRVCECFADCAAKIPNPIAVNLEKVRFTGYYSYGLGSCNVPIVLVSVTLFPKRTVTKTQLDDLALDYLFQIDRAFRGFHMIAKIYCGTVYGFAELNKPE